PSDCIIRARVPAGSRCGMPLGICVASISRANTICSLDAIETILSKPPALHHATQREGHAMPASRILPATETLKLRQKRPASPTLLHCQIRVLSPAHETC